MKGSALEDYVLASVSTRIPRPPRVIYQIVANDYGSVSLRSIQRVLARLRAARRVIRVGTLEDSRLDPNDDGAGYLRAQ